MNRAERYKEDLKKLAERGFRLLLAFHKATDPKAFAKAGYDPEKIKDLPNIFNSYEAWYSEALACVSQLLPERVSDFTAYYRHKTQPKEITAANYTMSDFLRGIQTSRGSQVVVSPSGAFAPLQQQVNIVAGLQRHFESTLFDIKTLVHADLLDDELHAAEELNKNGFTRGAGAVAGVVLEGHLGAVSDRHKLSLKKKDPSIADLNEALKAASVIDIPTWRFIQHLEHFVFRRAHNLSS
jgi:hypothetical protein